MTAADTQQKYDWAELAMYGERHTFQRNSTIFAADTPADTLFLLHSGQVRLPLRSPEGRSLTLQVMEAGRLFGHMALVEHAHYDTSAEALRTVEATLISREQLRRLMLSQPPLALALLHELANYRVAVSQRLEEVTFKQVPARLASLLVHMVEGGSAPTARLPRRTHQQLAEMINAYRETVTKVINQFRDARLLDVDRSGITLLNLAQLRKMAQE